MVDTVGAGDGFVAGLLSRILDRKSFRDYVKIGNAVVSIVIQHKGDNALLPNKEEIEEYISKKLLKRIIDLFLIVFSF